MQNPLERFGGVVSGEQSAFKHLPCHGYRMLVARSNPFEEHPRIHLIIWRGGAYQFAGCSSSGDLSLPQTEGKTTKNALVKIVLLAILNTGYNSLLTVALRYFNATSGAFTFAMTIVVVPIVLLAGREQVNKSTWVGTLCIFIGILVGLGPDLFNIEIIGLVLLLVACVIRAVYIVMLNRLVKTAEPGKVSIVMLFFVAAISSALWCLTDIENVLAFNIDASGFSGIFIYALAICALCNVLNLYAQKTASAQQATIIYSLEIVFSVLFAAFLPSVLVDTVQLSINSAVGSLFVCVGNVVANLDLSDLKARRLEKKAASRSLGQQLSFVDPHAPLIKRVIPFLTLRDAAQTLLLLAVYLALAIPVLAVIYDEQLPATLRLAPMLIPMLAAFFGWRGAWVLGIGNLLFDLINNDFGIWSPFTAVGNALYVVILAAFLSRLINQEGYVASVKNFFWFVGGILIASLVGAPFITIVVALTQPPVAPIALQFFEVVFGTNMFVAVMPGLAVAILLSTEFGFKPYQLFRSKETLRKRTIFKKDMLQ